jgi:hypothetical protein
MLIATDGRRLAGAPRPRSQSRVCAAHRTAILVLVEGGTMREAGKRCGLKDSAALVLKRRRTIASPTTRMNHLPGVPCAGLRGRLRFF